MVSIWRFTPEWILLNLVSFRWTSLRFLLGLPLLVSVSLRLLLWVKNLLLWAILLLFGHLNILFWEHKLFDWRQLATFLLHLNLLLFRPLKLELGIAFLLNWWLFDNLILWLLSGHLYIFLRLVFLYESEAESFAVLLFFVSGNLFLSCFLLKISSKLDVDVWLVAYVILLEPFEVALVHWYAQWLHPIKNFVFLRLLITLSLELLLNLIFHWVLLWLGVIIMEYRHLMLHKLRERLTTNWSFLLQLRHLRFTVLNIVHEQKILLRVRSWSTLGWRHGLGFRNLLIRISLDINRFTLRRVKHSDQLFLDRRSSVTKGVTNDSLRSVASVLELFLGLFTLFSLPLCLIVTIKLGNLISNIEVFDLKFELLSPMLILDLLKPLSRLAEIFLGKELLSLFLDDDSVNVSKPQVSWNMRFLDPYLLLKFFEIVVAVQFQIWLQLRLG